MSDVVTLADEYWDYYRATAQLWNIDRGDVDQIDQWEDLSVAGVATRLDHLAAIVEQAQEIVSRSLQGE